MVLRLLLIFGISLFGDVRQASGQPSVPNGDGPIVIELYTSQGCVHCPQADLVLAALAHRPGILALSFHVPYWDHMGWPDPYALPVSVLRQRGYARAMKSRSVYTPQVIIQASTEVIGSDRDAIEARLGTVPAARALVLALEHGRIAVTVPDGIERMPAELWLVGFLRGGERYVPQGENAGLTLKHANIVRWAEMVAVIERTPARFEMVLPPAWDSLDGVAALLQPPRMAAPMLAAGSIPLR